MEATIAKTKRRRTVRERAKRSSLLFYALFMLIPTVHFFVFYLYVNFDSFLMAFRNYQLTDNGIATSFAGWSNFQEGWSTLAAGNGYRIRNTLIFFAVQVFVSGPLSILAAYYIYKKKFFSGFFRVMLFMPQVLSAVVMGTLYKYVMGNGLSWIVEKASGVSMEYFWKAPSTNMWAMILFNVIMSFGVNVLLYTNAMSALSTSVMESAKLEGCTPLQELWHIVLPGIFPTISSLLLVDLCGCFMNQYGLWTIYEAQVPSNLGNVGHFLYWSARDGDLFSQTAIGGVKVGYPQLAAIGLILTFLTIPVAFLTRYLLNRFGPSEE